MLGHYGVGISPFGQDHLLDLPICVTYSILDLERLHFRTSSFANQSLRDAMEIVAVASLDTATKFLQHILAFAEVARDLSRAHANRVLFCCS